MQQSQNTVLPRHRTTAFSYEMTKTTYLIETRAARFVISNNWFDDRNTWKPKMGISQEQEENE